MSKLNESDMWLRKANLARLEAMEFLLPTPHVPVILKDQLPLTDDGGELKAGAQAVMRLWKEIADAYSAFDGSPWDESRRLASRSINWTGVEAADVMAMGLERLPDIPALPAIKHGKGIDPADRTTKPYILFREVERRAHQVGVAEYFDMEKEYQPLLEKWTLAEEGGDTETANELKEQCHAVLRRMTEWRKQWEIRTAGPNADKVKRLHQLEDELHEVDRQVYDDQGHPKVSADSDAYRTHDRLNKELDRLRKELGR